MDQSLLFWTQVSAIGQIVGALATAAAVIVALWIALSERQANVKLRAGLRLIIAGDGSPANDFIAFEITNHGLRTVRVNSVGWRTGWTRHGPRWLKRQFALQNPSRVAYSPPLPFDVPPGQAQTVLVSAAEYLGAASQKREDDFFTRKLPFRKERMPANIRATAHLVAFKSVSVKVEKPLANFLATGKIDNGATQFNERANRRLSL